MEQPDDDFLEKAEARRIAAQEAADQKERLKEEEETKKKAINIHKDIDNLQKELNDLQESCKHTDAVIKQRPGDTVKKYCVACDKYLNYPTEQELKDYLYGNDRSTRKD
jgi:hypothetical protein|tara:strand:- start:8 stop:334 length:327 start_codon:yes stop_codon:yes gene_type:complete